MYGKRKPIAVRKPLFSTGTRKTRQQKEPTPPTSSHEDSADGLSTPAATEGETASETDLETETETESHTPTMQPKKGLELPPLRSESPRRAARQSQQVSQHDLHHKYFRRDVVVMHNLDLLRYSPRQNQLWYRNSLNRILSASGPLMRC